ncbi:unnamed protein product [Chrysoparadoxa australica]
MTDQNADRQPARIVLTYFDIPGSAEAIRLTFHIAGVPFVDRRIGREEFLEMKPDLPFGQLPILEVDGEVIPQSGSILRYVGKISGLYPEDALAAAQCDAVIDGMIDIQMAIRPTIYEKNLQRRAKLGKELAAQTLPMWLGYMEKLLQKGGGEFFVGGSLTICDLVIFTRMKWLQSGVLDCIPKDALDRFPLLSALTDRVCSHPKVTKYYQECQECGHNDGHSGNKVVLPDKTWVG